MKYKNKFKKKDFIINNKYKKKNLTQNNRLLNKAKNYKELQIKFNIN